MTNKVNRRKAFIIMLILMMTLTLIPTTAFGTTAELPAGTPSDEVGAGEEIAAAEPVLPANQAQVVNAGGTNSDGIVTVSKTLEGTDIENVFDITLTVNTQNKIEEIYKAQDMAVVIVMDISNTMNETLSGADSRYDAALAAAKNFIDKFQAEAANYPDVSRKIGYVAFNTNAHQIASLQNCVTPEEADALKNTITANTGSIINNYSSNDITRFTNIEAGLKMGYDMLASAQENNKYIIFLSDGFPTTYVSSGYNGYNPYMNQYTGDTTPGTDGYFFDQVYGKPCTYSTSYSDKGADRADDMAAAIKAAGSTIFSIGVGLGDQTVDGFYNRGEGYDPATAEFTVNDVYPGGNYVIGKTADSYKSWLRSSIGSGYYYDSTDTTGLNAAYDSIFAEIKALNQESVQASWVVTDPMNESGLNYIDFISFYNKDGVLTGGSSLYGEWSEGAEDTAVLRNSNIIDWDLKNSGYSLIVNDDQTQNYEYSLKYRVRLANEAADFVEYDDYDTNGRTTLTYQVYNNGLLEDPKTIDFPVPVVEGYLCEFEFTKLDGYTGQPLAGATFELRHDADCSVCAQMGKLVNVPLQSATSEVTEAELPEEPAETPAEGNDSIPADVPAEEVVDTAVADENGKIRFENIPSGHEYTLYEADATGVYVPSPAKYSVVAAYNQLTITPEAGAAAEAPYNIEAGTFVNYAGVVGLYAQKSFIHAETQAPVYLPAGKFEFQLLDADKKVLQTKTNNAQGYAYFDTVILDEIAETKFFIREVNKYEDGITYDETVYEVTVTPVINEGVYEGFDVVYAIEGQPAAVEVIPAETTETAVPVDVQQIETLPAAPVEPVFVNTFTDPTYLTVLKVWDHKDNDAETLPAEATVQLYKDGRAYGDPVVLNEESQWTFTWNGLSGTALWEVREINVPEDYHVNYTVSEDNKSVTVTNVYDPYTPPPYVPPVTPLYPDPDPKDPEVPEEPEVPDVPVDPEDPPTEDLVEFEDPEVPLTEIPEELEEFEDPEVPLANVPATGSKTMAWASMMLISFSGLALLLRKRENETDN